MKRLLVLMMCAMLAIPSVAMNVQAVSEPTQNAIDGAEKEKEFIEQLNTEEDDDELLNTDPNSPEKIEAERATAIKDLNDYYLNHDFTAVEITKANSVMNEAGKKLGYKFENGSFVENGTCALGTVQGIKDHVAKMKVKLDNCKIKETV